MQSMFRPMENTFAFVDEREIYLPNENSSPMKINLASLRLNSSLLNAQEREDDAPVQISKVGTLSVDPRALPLADIAVKELYLDDVNYGNWSLEIRPNDKGVSFDKLTHVKGVASWRRRYSVVKNGCW